MTGQAGVVILDAPYAGDGGGGEGPQAGVVVLGALDPRAEGG